jgi:hypothetical protein
VIVEVRDSHSIQFSVDDKRQIRVCPDQHDSRKIEAIITALLDAYHSLVLYQKNGVAP